MLYRLTTIVFTIALSASLIRPSNAADSPEGMRSRLRMPKKQIAKQKQRDRKTALEKSSAKAESTEKSAVRYQMRSAGDRVVILDTHTGETKVIEPQAAPAYQNVEVGRAWVVVTVLGNVSEIPRFAER